jgi:hypothetical protein
LTRLSLLIRRSWFTRQSKCCITIWSWLTPRPVVQRSERSEKNDREPIDAQVNTKRYSRPPTVHSVAATSAARSRIAEALRDGTDISPRPDPAAAARPPSMYSQAQGRPRAASETRWGGPAPGAPSALGLTGLEDEHQHYDGRGTRAPTVSTSHTLGERRIA